MFIYILNILNDSIRRNEHDNNFLGLKLISDAKCISELNVINNKDEKIISSRLNNVFEIFLKYNLSSKESENILNKVFNISDNKWILEQLHVFYINYKLNNYNIITNSIMDKIIPNEGREYQDIKINCYAM